MTKKKESAKQTRICFIFVEATALFCDDSCSWVQAQEVQAVTTWFGTLVQDPDRQSTEAGRPCVNWGEPLNLWSKAYLKEREELVGKKKVETIPRPVSQPMRARPREKVGGPFSKVSGLELPVAEGLRQGFVSSSPTQGKDYDQVYVSRHQKAATLPH